jgi:hypothetical protein
LVFARFIVAEFFFARFIIARFIVAEFFFARSLFFRRRSVVRLVFGSQPLRPGVQQRTGAELQRPVHQPQRKVRIRRKIQRKPWT